MVNQELLSYIKQQQAAGVSKEEITKQLVSAGWDENDVVAGLVQLGAQSPVVQRPTPPPAPVSPVLNMRSSELATPKSHLALYILIGGLLCIAAVSAAGYAYLEKIGPFSVGERIDGGDIAEFDDSDLRIIPDTTAIDCSEINNLALSDTDRELIMAYGTTTSLEKAPSTVAAVLSKYSNQIDRFLISTSTWTEHVGAVDKNNVFQCKLKELRSYGLLVIAKAKSLANDGKLVELQGLLTKHLARIQRFEDNPQTLIPYLIALDLKGRTVDLLALLKRQGLVSEAFYRPLLEKYGDNITGHKKGLQSEYTLVTIVLDNLNANTITPNDREFFGGDAAADEFLAAFVKEKNDLSFQINKTKRLFYDLFSTLYTNIDKPCGSVSDIEVHSPNYDDRGENYLGRILFAKLSPGLQEIDAFHAKRCALDQKMREF